MHLLSLPSELVREILHTLDPQSFFNCLQTSKIFREHALASTSLLKDHLDRIPGTRIVVQNGTLDTTLLLRMFGQRASQHLLNGSDWRTDLHLFDHLFENKRVDRKNSLLVRTSWPKEDWSETYTSRGFAQVFSSLMFINVILEDNLVRIFFMESASRERYLPNLRYVIVPPDVSQFFPSAQEEGSQLEIVKVAPYTPDPSMLFIEGHPGPRVGVLYRLKKPDAPMLMKLLIFRLDSKFGPVVIEALDIQCNPHQRVVSLAISDQREAVIAWNFRNLKSEFDIVTIYTAEEDKISLERRTRSESPIIPSFTHPSRPDRIGGVVIKGRTVHLHTTAYPVPQWTLPSISRASDQVERRDTHLPYGVEDFIRPLIGIPIAHHHHHMVEELPNRDGTPSCVNTALELVVSRHFSNANTTTNWSLPPRSGAYIMKAVHYPSHCKPFSMTKDHHHLRHTYAARLVGVPDLFSLSTLGLLLAVSPKAYRIAIVSWKTVRVWAIDSRALLDREYSLGCDDHVPGDYAFTEGCGWQFYKKDDLLAGSEFDTVDLYPVDLPSAGVLHSIEFRGEDELWGWGERGLVRWNFDTYANGTREVSSLEG
ncbi:hypothetical protein BDV96DRAFT_646014 [Lophiotrema nucula]|uniref:F-box domain-containing protein n=1 Tax=Lophiotrema nucula TaxID=690887 RepID=A0A6A5Z9S8_9PLEO|nr:hypothetical protein BDV96DRAFT_646014 [Lophiotrema nucula]